MTSVQTFVRGGILYMAPEGFDGFLDFERKVPRMVICANFDVRWPNATAPGLWTKSSFALERPAKMLMSDDEAALWVAGVTK